MAKQTINLGTGPNTGTGEPIRTAFGKVNENFTEVYGIAQSAYDYANTIVSDTQVDPLARSTANSAYNQANSAATLAQASYDYANTIVSDTQVDPLARSTANSAWSTANAAFDQANNGGLTASSVATLTNKTFDVSVASNNTFSIQGQSIASYSGSGQVLLLQTSPTINVLNLRDSNLNLDGGSGSFYWSGQSGVAQAGDLKAGVYSSDPTLNNSLFTFGSAGSNNMSVGIEGSLFIGTAMPSNNGGLNTTFPGWLVVQSGAKFGGTINTLGALQFDDPATANIIFADGTYQNTAYQNVVWQTANSAWSTANAAFNQANTGGNPFDQDLNTSNNVTFNEVTSNNVYFDNLNLTGNVFSSSACSAINFIANSSGDGANASTIELIPDTNLTGTDQYLIIDPTAPGHIHIRAGGTQDSSSAELFLGGENSYVKVGAGFNPPVTITSNAYSWDFDVNGDLAVPGKIYLNNNNQNVLTFDQFGIRADSQMVLSAENFATGNNSSILFDKNGGGIVFRLEDTTPVSKNWSFYQNSLVFPDSTTQTTAFTLTPTLNSLTVNGKSKLAKVVEPFSSVADATGVVTHDCTNNHIFYHTSLDANFTANFTNLSLANGEATSLTLVLSQGGTAYIANNVQIEGNAQTIKWSANTVPTGNTNAVDVQSFSVLRVSGNYIVLGQLSTFG